MTPIANLPVFLRLAGRKAVIAGSGDSVAWKVELLAAAGADVRLFSPSPTPKVAEALARASLVHEARPWVEADLRGALVALLDTRDNKEAQRFREAAHRAGAMVNVIDRPMFCDFSFGSIVDRSPLIIAVSTDGAAPVFAQVVRSRIEAMFPDTLREWAQAARTWRGHLAYLEVFRRRAVWTQFAKRALASVDQGPTEADFTALDKGRPVGRLIVVGVGPGDVDLVTLRAVRALQAADFVLEDGRIDPKVRDLGRREAGLEQWPSGADAVAQARAIGRVSGGAIVVVLRPGDGRSAEWESAAALANVVYTFAPGLMTR